MKNGDEGYLLIGIGKKSIEECNNLISTIRLTGDLRPCCLLTSKVDVVHIGKYKHFNNIKIFEPFEDDIWAKTKTNHDKYGSYPRYYANEFSPYKKTILLDSDVLCQYSLDKVWSYLNSLNKAVIMIGKKIDPKWHWGKINNIIKRYGKNIPHVHGGFFYFKKEKFTKIFFKTVREFYNKYDELGCLRAHKGNMCNEILFALAHAELNMNPLDFHNDPPIMCFNYPEEMIIPSSVWLGNEGLKIFDSPIPLVHMFDQLYGKRYKSLLRKIINLKS